MCYYEDDLVSVIVPVYNGESFIEQAILSVRNQTYLKWEMIIIDDCSVDGSRERVLKHVHEDGRIRYYNNEKNLGAARSRNRAMELARGRYIAFLDSDDVWKNSKLEKQLNYMQEKDIGFCYSACGLINKEGEPCGKSRAVPPSVSYKQLLKGNVIPCLTVVIDRSKCSDVKMPMLGHEDYATWLGLLKGGMEAYGINEELAAYRVDSSSLSGNKLKAAKWTWNIYRRYLGFNWIKSSYYFVWYVLNSIIKRI